MGRAPWLSLNACFSLQMPVLFEKQSCGRALGGDGPCSVLGRRARRWQAGAEDQYWWVTGERSGWPRVARDRILRLQLQHTAARTRSQQAQSLTERPALSRRRGRQVVAGAHRLLARLPARAGIAACAAPLRGCSCESYRGFVTQQALYRTTKSNVQLGGVDYGRTLLAAFVMLSCRNAPRCAELS